jgi:RimJ/RimL family protein N-acetyltransferase
MTVVPFLGEHMAQVGQALALTPGQIAALERGELSWTALDDAGDVIGCAGVVKVWQGRYAAWAALSPERSGSHMRALTKAACAFFETLGAGRVELSVREGFEPGHRWADMLGFTLETAAMPRYGADGATHAMYVRIQP